MKAGVYHFRYYYIGLGGKLMMYHPPGELAQQMKLEGMDGVLRVSDGVPAA